MGKADLHTHTSASDGELSPKQLIEKAVEKGLDTISITDHDTIKGYLDVKDLAGDYGITIIPGVEVSAKWNDREVHILAYNFDVNDPALIGLLHNQVWARKLRMKAIVKHLRSQGVDIDYDEVLAESFGGNIGRPHAASVLIKKRYARSVQEAFIRYLGNSVIQKIETEYTTVEDLVTVIKNAGGVLSIAHPSTFFTETEMEQLISFGIDGVECIHPSHNFNLQKKYLRFAKKNQLLITGGSDFHGKSKTDYDPFFGIVTLGSHHVEALIRTSDNRRSILEKQLSNG